MQALVMLVAVMAIVCVNARGRVLNQTAVDHCKACKVAAHSAEEIIELHEPEIQAYLGDVCKTIKEPRKRSVCEEYIKVNLQETITQLITDHPPEVICEEIKVCKKRQKYWMGFLG
jgi:hypothetical protein